MTLTNWSAELHTLVANSAFTDALGRPLESEEGVEQALALLREVKARDGSMFVIGNGGSAAIASHAVVDFLNVGGMRAMTMNDPAVTSCMANDFGYAQVFARPLEVWARPGDLLIAISSSGRSPNIQNAVTAMHAAGGKALTLSGFAPDNPLRQMGDLNLHLASSDYGLVEVGHQIVLHHLANILRLERIPAHAAL